MVTESREENSTSWYSGLASYVVGAWPQDATSPVGSPLLDQWPDLLGLHRNLRYGPQQG